MSLCVFSGINILPGFALAVTLVMQNLVAWTFRVMDFRRTVKTKYISSDKIAYGICLEGWRRIDMSI